MEPYGASNPSPIFIMRGVRVASHNKMGKDKSHLRLNLCKNDNFVIAIGWRMGSLAEEFLSNANQIDLAFHVEINRWQGKEYVQLVLKDIKRCKL